ncbi:MAG: adaptor protein MecA [Eubacteriales bacterium]|nr:adaptor protein MecA [Eubacteriales bacterium]
MKLEKLNDNQIKCTLHPTDLIERKLTPEHLSYNSDGIQELFRDVLHLARDKYDFNTEASPLMVEAIPSKNFVLTLLISKIDNIEEIDNRFSTFTDRMHSLSVNMTAPKGSEKSFAAPIKGPVGGPTVKRPGEADEAAYEFEGIRDVYHLAKVARHLGHLDNYLYQNPKNRHYILYVCNKYFNQKHFNHYLDFISEYGRRLSNEKVNVGFFEESYRCIIRRNALQAVKNYINADESVENMKHPVS